MNVTVTGVNSFKGKTIVTFRSGCSVGTAEWVGETPVLNQNYNVEVELLGIIEEGIHLHEGESGKTGILREDEHQMMYGTVERTWEDYTASISVAGSAVLITYSDRAKVAPGRWVAIVADKLRMHTTNI